MAPKAMAKKATAKTVMAKKAGGAAMSKGGLAEAIAAATGHKKAEVSKVLEELTAIGTKEVKSKGIFTLPGLARIKTRVKPATKAGKRVMFGKEVAVKAKPATTVVKAFPVAALKSAI